MEGKQKLSPRQTKGDKMSGEADKLGDLSRNRETLVIIMKMLETNR